MRIGRSNASDGVEFAVLVPLEDMRGDVVEHLRTWTHEQSFPRERFQMVIASDGSDPEAEHVVSSLLEPHDVLARADTSHVVGLWREAARRAEAPWLVLTEAHCHADPGCLAAAAGALRVEPDLDAAMFTHGHIAHSTPGELTARWFTHSYSEWSKSDWAHLNLVGAAVRRELFEELDAFQPRYGLFSPVLLSARLHERGAKVGEVTDAVVSHVYHDTLSEHHANSFDSATGECEVRRDFDDDFCERYFGRIEAWSGRLCYRPALAREMTRALLAHASRAITARRSRSRTADPDAQPLLARELAAWLPRCAVGARPRAAREQLDSRASEWATERLPLPDDLRWRGYLRAQERVVRTARLRWIHNHVTGRPRPAPVAGAWTAEQLDGAALVGAHALERREDGAFRWTEPAAMLRALPPAGPHLLRIDTHGVRGAPLDYVLGVYVAGRALPASAIHDDAGQLLVELPDDVDRSAEGIVVLCRPLEPRLEGSSDPRRLGMPIFSAELCPAR